MTETEALIAANQKNSRRVMQLMAELDDARREIERLTAERDKYGLAMVEAADIFERIVMATEALNDAVGWNAPATLRQAGGES